MDIWIFLDVFYFMGVFVGSGKKDQIIMEKQHKAAVRPVIPDGSQRADAVFLEHIKHLLPFIICHFSSCIIRPKKHQECNL
ncbi:Uncharacterised protein [Mycobacteroides abscessus subsp. abscessus]|nr:Uncharacterised protein [Mycobacteroides abscessus subsp. abscessus]